MTLSVFAELVKVTSSLIMGEIGVDFDGCRILVMPRDQNLVMPRDQKGAQWNQVLKQVLLLTQG